MSEAIKLEYEAYSSIAKSHLNSRELNDAERAKLNELIVANKALHEPLDDDLSTLIGDDTCFKVRFWLQKKIVYTIDVCMQLKHYKHVTPSIIVDINI